MPRTAYTYAVRGTASVSGVALVSSYTAAAAVVTIPSAPALLPVGQGSQDSLVVSWTAPAGQLSPITGYVLERSLTGTDGWTTLPTTGLLTSLTDTGLAFLTTYHYRVATVTAVGQSAWSAIQSATTGLAAPATATAAASTTAAEVTVTWTAVPTVTAYEVARSDGASFVPPGSSLTATSAGLTFVDPTVVHGSTYTYAVRALVGPTSSGWATTNPVTTIPTAPSGLVVTATATSVNATANLAWTADPAATGYVVQRSTDAAFTAPVAVTAIDMATASDLGLAFVTTYYYRVAAVNPTGQSAWSASSSVTTPLGQPSAFTATDTGYRFIDRTRRDVVLGHWSPNFDHTGIALDLNVVYPIDRLEELASRGVIGAVAPRHVSFAGNQPDDVATIRLDSGPAAAAALRDDGVDVVLLTPV